MSWNPLDFNEFLKIVLMKMSVILMSVKLAAPGLLKKYVLFQNVMTSTVNATIQFCFTC